MEPKNLIGNLNIVVPDVRAISGAVSRGESEGDAFSTGQVFYLDKKELQVFGTARSAMNRICRMRGVRFLSGYAVPDNALDAVLAQLEAKRKEVQDKTEEFLGKMPALMDEWRAAHPEIAPWIGSFPSAAEARKRFAVSISVFKVMPDQAAGGDVLSEVGGLAGRALEEISMDVRLSWDPSRGETTQKARGILRRVTTKLRSLAILSPDFSGVADAIDQVQKVIPNDGKIAGRDFMILSGLMQTLQRPADLLRLSEQLHVISPEDMWGGGYTGAVQGPGAVETPVETPTAKEGFRVMAFVETVPYENLVNW